MKTAVIDIRDWIRTNGDMSEDGKAITYNCKELEKVIAEALKKEKEQIIDFADTYTNDVMGGCILRAKEYYDKHYNQNK